MNFTNTDGASTPEAWMSKEELKEELMLQQGMLASLDQAAEGYEESRSVIEHEVNSLRVKLAAFKQQKKPQSDVVLKGPFAAAAASSSSKSAWASASTAGASRHSKHTSSRQLSVSTYDQTDPFFDPFDDEDQAASMDTVSDSNRGRTSAQANMLRPTSQTILPHRNASGNMKRSIDESIGLDIKEESDNKSRRTSPDSSVPTPTVYKEDQNGFIDLCSDEEDAIESQKKAFERVEKTRKDLELAQKMQKEYNGISASRPPASSSRPDAFSRMMGSNFGSSHSTPALNAGVMQAPNVSNSTKSLFSVPGAFPTAVSADFEVEFMSSKPVAASFRRPSVPVPGSRGASYSSSLSPTWQNTGVAASQRPTSVSPYASSPYTTQAGVQYSTTQGPYSSHNLAQANGMGIRVNHQSSLFNDIGMPGSSWSDPIDMLGNTSQLSESQRDRLYNYVTDPRQTKEDIKNLLANISPDMEIPKEDREGTPDGLRYSLYEHQKVALTWLKAAETSTNKGGILADDMGLGKTVSTIALLLARPSPNRACKTTLIVAPVALLRQWEKEIGEKVLPSHKMSVFVYHSGKTKSYQDMRNYDVVLTSYGTLGSEYKKLDNLQQRKMQHKEMDITADLYQKQLPFLGIKSKWYRVALDEAQNVKNKDTKSAKAVSLLQSQTRFCLTGTPMMNGVHELFSLIRFMRIRPYNDFTEFQSAFGILKKGTGSERQLKRALTRLQALLRSILLRRTKDSTIDGEPIIKLPPKTEEVVHAIFDEDQQNYYTALESKSKVTFNKYLKAGTVGKNYSSVLVLLLRLRQAACHPHLIMDFEQAALPNGGGDQVALAKTLPPDVVRRLMASDFPVDCPVCYDPLLNAIFTLNCCHHVCSECLVKITSNVDGADEDENGRGPRARCPTCRGEIDINKCIDWTSFQEAHMGVKSVVEDDDSPSDDADTDSDSDTVSEADVDANENLKDFIVDDDEIDDGFPSRKVASKKKKQATLKLRPSRALADDTDSDDTDDDDLDVEPVKLESKVEDSEDEAPAVKPEKIEDSEDDYLPDYPIKKPKAELASDDYLPENPAEARARGLFPEKLKDVPKKITKEADDKASPKLARDDRRKTNGKKPKGRKENEKAPHKHLNLATLKKEASKNASGRKKYMRYLRKNWVTSAKIDKLMELLTNTPKDVKTIVFSQFTTLLDLCEIPITAAGIKLGRYDGSMRADMRHVAVETFQHKPHCQVLLVSLKAGNAGLNLIAGSQVVILDPFWNPYVEMQAVDRAHRIGQQKPVTVHRILIKGTVEDRIISLQERKRKLVDSALDEKSGNAVSKLGVEELTYLFNCDGDARETLARTPQIPGVPNFGNLGGGLGGGQGPGLGSALNNGLNAGLDALGSGAGFGAALDTAARGFGAAVISPYLSGPGRTSVYGGRAGGGGSGGGNLWYDAMDLINDGSSEAASPKPEFTPEYIAFGNRHNRY